MWQVTKNDDDVYDDDVYDDWGISIEFFVRNRFKKRLGLLIDVFLTSARSVLEKY